MIYSEGSQDPCDIIHLISVVDKIKSPIITNVDVIKLLFRMVIDHLIIRKKNTFSVVYINKARIKLAHYHCC